MPLSYDSVIWTKETLISAIGGEWLSQEPWSLSITGVCSAPVLLQKNDLFIIYEQNRELNSQLMQEVHTKGACLIIVDKDIHNLPSLLPTLKVKNALETLKMLASEARNRSRAVVIGITGSVGKTSAKDTIVTALETQKPTYSNFRSINGGAKLYIQIAGLPIDCGYAVFEMGMLRPHTIGPMAMFVKPDIGVITSIEPVHISYHNDNINSIIQTKAEIVDGMSIGAPILLPKDSNYYDQLKKTVHQSDTPPKDFGFGFHKEADSRIISLANHSSNSIVTADIFGKTIQYKVGLPGRYWAINSIIALACTSLAGGDIQDAAAAMSLIAAPFRRGEKFRALLSGGGSVEIYDDTWGANPLAVQSSLEVIKGIEPAPNGRRIAVLGDMLELGTKSAQYHEGLLEYIIDAKIDLVCTVGTEMEALKKILPNELQSLHTVESIQMAKEIKTITQSGDIILIKGSNSMHMWRVVAAFIGDRTKAQIMPSSWTVSNDY